jgi:hypothetical protein
LDRTDCQKRPTSLPSSRHCLIAKISSRGHPHLCDLTENACQRIAWLPPGPDDDVVRLNNQTITLSRPEPPTDNGAVSISANLRIGFLEFTDDGQIFETFR